MEKHVFKEHVNLCVSLWSALLDGYVIKENVKMYVVILCVPIIRLVLKGNVVTLIVLIPPALKDNDVEPRGVRKIHALMYSVRHKNFVVKVSVFQVVL